MIRVSTQEFTSLVCVKVQFELAVRWNFSAKTMEHNFEIECCYKKLTWIICALDYLHALAFFVFRKRKKLERNSHPNRLSDHSGCCHEIKWQLDPVTKLTLHGRSYAVFQKPDASFWLGWPCSSPEFCMKYLWFKWTCYFAWFEHFCTL